MDEPRIIPPILQSGEAWEKQELAKSLRKRMTATEMLLWQQLRDNRLLGLSFRRQQVIGGFITDFYCHAIGLVIEVDGMIHNYQTKYDKERSEILTSRNLIVIRFTNDEVETKAYNVVARIRETAYRLKSNQTQ